MSEPDFLTSTLRIFLSVDIVGSTEFKQGQAASHKEDTPRSQVEPRPVESPSKLAEAWFSPIAQFYREVERQFAREWKHYSDKISKSTSWPAGPSPEFWKGAGDELIYTKVLTDHKEALVCLQAWMKAINAYRISFKATYPSLDLKCTAWLAGFPVHNAEVFFRSSFSDVATEEYDDAIYSNMELMKEYASTKKENRDSNIVRDFIGPSMDTGFRLSSLASPRKLIISVDLALLLVHASRTQQDDFGYDPIKFHYDGKVPLKGVFGGTPYPVFWIDMEPKDALNEVEDELARTIAVDSDRVKKFCELFINRYPNFVFKPYIVGDQTDPFFRKVPEAHSRRIETLKSYWTKESRRRSEEAKANEVPATEDASNTSRQGKSLKWVELLNKLESLSRPPSTDPRRPRPRAAKGKMAGAKTRAPRPRLDKNKGPKR